MTAASLLVFATAYGAVVLLPGPSIVALVARVLARGLSGAAPFIAGVLAGSLIWFTVAATGLAALAASFAGVLVAVRYLGAAYLLFLAWKLWTAPPRPMQAVDASPDGAARLFLAGLSLHIGNPKPIVFFLALLPTVVDLQALTLLGFAELAAAIVCIVSVVMGGYALAASRARTLFTAPRAMRLVNRGSGLVMAGAAVAVAAR